MAAIFCSCNSISTLIIGIEMAFTGIEKAFCVLEYAQIQSNKTVQCAFVRKFSKKSSTPMQIWTLHKNFREEGYLCRAKGFGQPLTSEETVERVRQNLLRSPKKSIRSSLETQIPPPTVWCILRKRLLMKPYKLQLVQAITADDKRMHKHGAM
ncbi:uncharacterized protein LOC115210815 isoform X2 [Octopus sinensis]|uniref:Uncharacterized protein LOC115210815 isoform X2 n=1 Tax=Octopus sinensis TaxID=2607531 RepID=A0A7E6ET96_9MOLL|nr:uncharacterized protein LOC115210815 isoform X2 [Octopus sinensis]